MTEETRFCQEPQCTNSALPDSKYCHTHTFDVGSVQLACPVRWCLNSRPYGASFLCTECFHFDSGAVGRPSHLVAVNAWRLTQNEDATLVPTPPPTLLESSPRAMLRTNYERVVVDKTDRWCKGGHCTELAVAALDNYCEGCAAAEAEQEVHAVANPPAIQRPLSLFAPCCGLGVVLTSTDGSYLVKHRFTCECGVAWKVKVERRDGERRVRFYEGGFRPY